MDKSNFNRSDSVDYLCLRSNIERVNWELNILREPFTNPDFYITQTLVSIYELLTINSPFTQERTKNLIVRLDAFPKIICDAKENLTEAKVEFAKIAIENLSDIYNKMRSIEVALKKESISQNQNLSGSFATATKSLIDYQHWLQNILPELPKNVPIGKESYEYFLRDIALIPYSTNEIINMGKTEFDRAVAFEQIEKQRNINSPKPKIFRTVEEEIHKAKEYEQQIRDFLESKNIMTVPNWLQHYTLRPESAKLNPIKYLSVEDDLTSENRLDENSVHYIPQPDSNLSFFYLSMAYDPRPIIIHEGIPGHYFQLATSWKNPDLLRRRFIDSGANEGIAFYVEEMLLQAGLFDDNPHTRETIYSFMRLRALRVEADVNLALGIFNTDEAADFLTKSVPMDKQTAIEDASFYSYFPGQAISYQIGKIQVMKFLSDAKLVLGNKFNLKNFHDFLMLNGNVPISLLRWEYLGLTDEIKQFFAN